MKIYSKTDDAITVLQGCALSCDWERWCAQYNGLSSNPPEFLKLCWSMKFLPTATILLQYEFPPQAENQIKDCVQHYFNTIDVHNSHEIMNFCRDIQLTDNTRFQKIGSDFVDTVCHRLLFDDCYLQPFVQWLEAYRCQTLHKNISRELTASQYIQHNRKM